MGLRSYFMKKKDEGFFKVNTGMLPVKIAYSLWSLGMGMIYPYLTLQAYEIGLTYEDISFIYGFIPFFTFFSSPISGFIGDMIGYKTVLIVNMVLACTASTLFDSTVPRYYEEIKTPTATVFVPTNGSAQIASIQWPICYHPTTNGTCEQTPSFVNGFDGIAAYVSCEDGDYEIDNLYSFDSAFVGEFENGTFCQSENSAFISQEGGQYKECEIVQYRELQTCVHQVGSHGTTFWTYFALRWLYNWGMNSAYSLFDGTAIRQAEKFNSDYSTVMVWMTLAQACAPFIAGAVIKDPEEGSDEEIDYQLAYYIMDGIVFVTCLISLRLEVTFQKSGDKVWVALKKLITPAALNFFALIFVIGFQWGIRDSYLGLYLQEDLGADSAFISYFAAIGSFSAMVAYAFAGKYVRKIGAMNILLMTVYVECTREIIYAYVDQSPPYYALGLNCLDFFNWGFGWLACVYYGNSITHPDLEATMVATIGSVEYIISKGLASLIGGQIIDNTSWETPELFKCTAVVAFVVATLVMAVYYLVTKTKYEKPQMEARKAVLKKIEERKMRRMSEANAAEGNNRHQMKKVDSVTEAAKEAYMTSHNNLYPLAMRREDSAISVESENGQVDFKVGGGTQIRHESIEEEKEEDVKSNSSTSNGGEE